MEGGQTCRSANDHHAGLEELHQENSQMKGYAVHIESSTGFFSWMEELENVPHQESKLRE